jgi:hypothetical protein
VPLDPRRTQQLDISNIISKHLDAGTTLPLPQVASIRSADDTQKFARPTMDDPPLHVQKAEASLVVIEPTQRLPRMEPLVSPDDTQKLQRPKLDEAPIRVQRVDQPAEAAGQTQQLPLRTEAPKAFAWKLPLAGVGAVVVLSGVAYWVIPRGPVAQPVVASPATKPGSVLTGVQEYQEKAKAGDVNAMRMLGTMYYNGLNVPQDREKGLYWYRKAAEKSEAARAELSQIEGGR